MITLIVSIVFQFTINSAFADESISCSKLISSVPLNLRKTMLTNSLGVFEPAHPLSNQRSIFYKGTTQILVPTENAICEQVGGTCYFEAAVYAMEESLSSTFNNNVALLRFPLLMQMLAKRVTHYIRSKNKEIQETPPINLDLF
ncbi:MAG: hypothetical protein ABL927_11930 [Bdellovibrionales bacterium]